MNANSLAGGLPWGRTYSPGVLQAARLEHKRGGCVTPSAWIRLQLLKRERTQTPGRDAYDFLDGDRSPAPTVDAIVPGIPQDHIARDAQRWIGQTENPFDEKISFLLNQDNRAWL